MLVNKVVFVSDGKFLDNAAQTGLVAKASNEQSAFQKKGDTF